jgi:hypothetical protein
MLFRCGLTQSVVLILAWSCFRLCFRLCFRSRFLVLNGSFFPASEPEPASERACSTTANLPPHYHYHYHYHYPPPTHCPIPLPPPLPTPNTQYH